LAAHELEHVSDPHPSERVWLLWDVADALFGRVSQTERRLAEDEGPTMVRLLETEQSPDQRGLAGSIAADEAQHAARRDPEGHISEHIFACISLRDPLASKGVVG
jgi:hypothetical protein